MDKRFFLIIVATCLVYLAPAKALELADTTVASGVGERLQAAVRFRADDGTIPAFVPVRLAGPGEFARAGLERPPVLEQLRFLWRRLDADNAEILIRSRTPIGQARLPLLLELDTRPDAAPQRFTAVLQLRPGDNVETEPARPSTHIAARIRVRPGDSLWAIAARALPDLPVQKAMAALVEKNPEAFIDSDPNRLIAGATLILPGGADAATAEKRPRQPLQPQPAPGRDDSGLDDGRLRIYPAPKPDESGKGAPPLHPEIQTIARRIETFREENQRVKRENQVLRERITLLQTQMDLLREQLLSLASYEQLLLRREKAQQARGAPTTTAERTPEPTDTAATTAPVVRPVPAVMGAAPPSAQQPQHAGSWLFPLYAALAAVLLFAGGWLWHRRREKPTAPVVTVMDVEKATRNRSKTPRAELDAVLNRVDTALAHGYTAEAERLLKRASERHPFDPMLMYRLLEIYAYTGNDTRFVTLVEQVQETLRRDAPEAWRQVEEFGRRMAPYHPLFVRSSAPQSLHKTA